MVALILADGEMSARADLDRNWPAWDADVDLVIAADGGARHSASLGLAIDLWVGDGDSIEPEALDALEASGVTVERSRPDKDESDTELAIRAAVRLGAPGVIILGALGGTRIDHVLANVGLLAMPELAGRTATILDGRARIRLIQAPGPDGAAVEGRLSGRIGDIVSLLPLGDGVEGVTTHGLQYALRDEPLATGPARGLSNVVTDPAAFVGVRHGRLLVIETPATL